MEGSGKLIYDKDIKYINKKLLSLCNRPLPRYQTGIIAMSYLNYLFEKAGITLVIVGGHAVELYTAGHYNTFDVDVIVSSREVAREVLKRTGFVKKYGERHWYHRELCLPIEIPDDVLAGSMDKIIEITTEAGFWVYVIGVEDLILDRVRAAVYRGSLYDREWALFLMNAQWNELDFDYLVNESQMEHNFEVYNLVIELKQETERIQES